MQRRHIILLVSAGVLILIGTVIGIYFAVASHDHHNDVPIQATASGNATHRPVATESTSVPWTGSTGTVDTPIILSPPAFVDVNQLFLIERTFPAFACEGLVFYAGRPGSPNKFSQNLLNEISTRTGVQPVIRVGGTSLDHSHYNPSQRKAVTFPRGTNRENVPKDIIFGPSYFDSFANFPQATYIIDVPLATDNITNILAFASAAYTSIGSGRIESLEVGNEPNFYPGIDRSRNSYGPQQYVAQWVDVTSLVAAKLGFSVNESMFQAVALASPRYPTIGQWTANNIFAYGLKDVTSRIKSYSIHYYQTESDRKRHASLQQDLMNHTAIVIGTGAISSTVSFLNSLSPRIPLNLGEVGSVLNFGGNNFKLESVLGAALWQVDLMLWCMSQGVHRVHYQLGIGFGFAPWRPTEYDDKPPSVNAPFYAHLLAADFIGTSTTLQVQNIDLSSDHFSAYAGYENGVLSRLAIVNLQEWSSTSGNTRVRPMKKFKITVPTCFSKAVVRRLTSLFGATAMESTKITWGGSSWSHASHGKGRVMGIGEDVTLEVVDGQVSVNVEASQAWVVWLH